MGEYPTVFANGVPIPDAVQQEVDDLSAKSQQIMRQAADDAYRAQLAFATGNFLTYWEQMGKQAVERMNAAYDELNGPRPQPADDNGTG